MPHFTIEYSANVGERTSMSEVVEVVRRAAVETGIFPLGGIRVRAIRCDDYAIADGNRDFGFLAMILRLGEGRDLAARKIAGQHIFETLATHLELRVQFQQIFSFIRNGRDCERDQLEEKQHS